MAKIILDTDSTNLDPQVLNENFRKIESELNEKVLYRVNKPNEPNAMGDHLDLNGKRLFNLPPPISPNEPLRLKDMDAVNAAALDARNSATSAEESASQAASSAAEAHDVLDGVYDTAQAALNAATTATNIANAAEEDATTALNTANDIDSKATQALNNSTSALEAANTPSDWTATSGPSQILNKPQLGTAASSDVEEFASASQGAKADSAVQPSSLGDLAYEDTVGVADISATGTPSANNYLRGDGTWATPDSGSGGVPEAPEDNISYARKNAGWSSLSTVATTGDYSDLANKPSIPPAQVNSDWTASSGVAEILNKPVLGTLSSKNSVSVSDISAGGTPSINTYLRGDGVWGTPEGGGGGGGIEEAPLDGKAYSRVNASWQSVSTAGMSGSYNDLLDKPTIPSAQVNSDWNAVSGVAQILNKPSLGSAAAANIADFASAVQGAKADTAVQPGELATVATSGLYADLSGKPSLGTASSADVGDFATSAQGDAADSALSLAQGALAKTSNLSDLNNIATARTNLGLGTAATYTVGTGPSEIPTNSQIPGSTAATTSTAGIVMLATAGEAIAGSNTTKALTSSNLASVHPRINRTSPSQTVVHMDNVTVSIGGVSSITFPSTGVWVVSWGMECNGAEVGRIVSSFWQASTEMGRGGTDFGNNQGVLEAWGSFGTTIIPVSSTSTAHTVRAYLVPIGTPSNTILTNLYFRAVRIGPVT